MKWIFISLLFFLMYSETNAQEGLGMTMERFNISVTQKYRNKGVKIENGFDNKINRRFISIDLDKAVISYYFNNSNICEAIFLVPMGKDILKEYIEYYNKEYVILSKNEWRKYTREGTIYIEFKINDKGNYYFLMTMEDD